MSKSVFITGGTSGIGRALVKKYIHEGYSVHTCGRNKDAIRQMKKQYVTYCFSIEVVDLRIKNECDAWIQSGLKQHKKIDVLILNAGISMKALIADTTAQVSEALMQTNFIASIQVVHAALPHIIENKATIAGISSIAGYVGLPGRAGYVASKAALNGWLDVLRKEMRQQGVSVVTIAPGFVASAIRQNALNAQGKPEYKDTIKQDKMMSAEECATRIYNAVQHKKISVKMTFQGRLAIALQRYVPKLADRLVHKKYIKNGKLVQ